MVPRLLSAFPSGGLTATGLSAFIVAVGLVEPAEPTVRPAGGASGDGEGAADGGAKASEAVAAAPSRMAASPAGVPVAGVKRRHVGLSPAAAVPGPRPVSRANASVAFCAPGPTVYATFLPDASYMYRARE